MRAMRLHEWGEPEQLRLDELPDPEPGPGQVSVRVRAAGCNFPDILLCQGKYQVKPPLPFSPGVEIAGEVLALGEGVDGVDVGDRVLGDLAMGGYASHVTVDSGRVYRIPDAMPFEEAAAFPIVYQTSYFALVHRAPVQPGQTLLVHGAAGGVGLSALQIGKARGARVIATAGSEAKRAFLREQGVDAVLDSRSDSWVEEVKELTAGRGADHIYDPVGGEIFDRSLKCIAFSGVLHVIGFASGQIPKASMNRVLLKNISLVGLHWGAYHKFDPEKIDEAMAALLAMYERGELQVHLGGRFPLERASEGLAEISSRRAQGKIVLTVG